MTKKIIKINDILRQTESLKCPVDRSRSVIESFLDGPMCGKCYPCSMGSYEANLRLRDLTAGMGTDEDIQKLKQIGQMMLTMSMCKKGKDVATFLLDALKSEAFKEHVEGICTEMECEAYFQYRNVPANCIRCGKCQDVCRYDAILGQKQKSIQCCHLAFEIRQLRCTKCGECIKVCPTKAIVKVVNIDNTAAVPA